MKKLIPVLAGILFVFNMQASCQRASDVCLKLDTLKENTAFLTSFIFVCNTLSCRKLVSSNVTFGEDKNKASFDFE